MRAYEIQGGTGNDGLAGLKRTERKAPKPGPGEVVVRVRAASLNYRDILIARDQYGTNGKHVVPLSDGAGEIAEVGAEVTRFRVGDRVVIAFAPDWIKGAFEARYRDTALGGHVDGVLAEYVAVRADALARVPDTLTFEQAATLPCAGVTAWNALFEEEHLRPGERVLVQGTGGVSMFALQLAREAGAKVIVTSSSDEKLERARKLGAEHGINYRTSPSWGDDVARLTSDAGVANVIEVGGAGTLAQSITAARVGGTISLIGVRRDGAATSTWARSFGRLASGWSPTSRFTRDAREVYRCDRGLPHRAGDRFACSIFDEAPTPDIAISTAARISGEIVARVKRLVPRRQTYFPYFGAFDQNQISFRTFEMALSDVLVLGRFVPLARSFDAREFHDDERGMPIAFERVDRSAAHGIASAVLLDAQRSKSQVIVKLRHILNFEVQDDVCAHGARLSRSRDRLRRSLVS